MLASGAPTETNHAATGSRCADEGLEVGQLWAYYSDDSAYGIVLEWYTIVGLAREQPDWGPARRRVPYVVWQVVITCALSGVSRTCYHRFPSDMLRSGYRRIS